MAESACWQCGQQGVVLKKCARCKNAAYCGAECQRLSWKQHKTACEVPLEEVCLKLEAAAHSEDWRGILTCEGRVEDLLDSILVDQDMEQKESDAACAGILDMFVSGHVLMIMDKRWSDESLLRFGKLAERRFALLANMELFRTQGEAMSDVGSAFFNAARLQQAATYLERARAVGAAHGFFSVESKACLGLGKVAVAEGRNAEGVAFLQNALAAAPLSEEGPGIFMDEMNVLGTLAEALFTTGAIDDLEPLVLRFRAAAKAETERRGGVCPQEVSSLYFSARLHEARGRPAEAVGEMRMLLDLLCESALQVMSVHMLCQCILQLHRAHENLKMLDPKRGKKELVKAVRAKLATLQLLLSQAQ
ncbi:hypothetical protein T484DRAFT_3613506 [Baffinella frigidus]|nr:hypothetical protein T484DRAFT_3613506 [Cryptophyta sp. CCMP2293]